MVLAQTGAIASRKNRSVTLYKVEQDKQSGHEVCSSVVKDDISARYLSPTRGLKRVDYTLPGKYSLIQSV